MTLSELLQLRNLAEEGQVQFKERLSDKKDLSSEMVAFSNSRGGRIIIGINDKTGDLSPLSFEELQATTNLVSNIASENVIPNILIDIENVNADGGGIVVVTVPEGKNKPYHDNKGIIWVKNGADKRKVFDNSEIAELMSECGRFDRDLAALPDASMEDLDPDTIKLFLMNRFESVFKNKGIDELNMKQVSLDQMASFVIKGSTIEKLFRNLRFIRPDGQITVAAMMLFGKFTQRWLPEITAKCISFYGNSVGGIDFRDKMHDMEIEGNLLHQFNSIMKFFTRNLHKVQVHRDFNSLGRLEVPYESLVEFIVNALVHRSLNIHAPLRIFIFDNRIEIHSPGQLPNGLTIEDIKNGTSIPRNTFLFNNAIYLLPYTGAGSGIKRALEYEPETKFSNGSHDFEIAHAANEFVITIPRKTNHDTMDFENPVVVNESIAEYSSSPIKEHKESDILQPDDHTDTLRDMWKSLSPREKTVINFCNIPRSSRDILSKIGLSNQHENRKRYITNLVEMGFLQLTQPDSPNSPKQKYKSIAFKKR